MAAAFTTTASVLLAPNALSSRGAAGLSSRNAIQTTSIVQPGPVTTKAHRMVAARAFLSAEGRWPKGSASGHSGSGCGSRFRRQSRRGPVEDANNQVDEKADPPFKLTPTSSPETTKSQQSFGNLPSDDRSVEDAKSAASDTKASAESLKSTQHSKDGHVAGQAKDAARAPKSPPRPDGIARFDRDAFEPDTID